MIEGNNISKNYGMVKVLDTVNFSIAKGEIVSIVGPSGAGKSTLLHIIGTLEPPDKGIVTLDGQDAFQLNARQLAGFRNEKIGFIFQFHHLMPEFTALENVMMPALIAKRSKSKKLEERARYLLDILHLGRRASHNPAQMSGGEQQRVAVARALMNEPSVVLADEPSGNLDSGNAEELHNLFFKLRKELGSTFIIVTHNEDLANMSDRQLLLHDGKLTEKLKI